MVGSVTTAFCTTAKQEIATGGHCFLANVSGLANTAATSANQYIIGLTSTAGIAVGMLVNSVSNTTANLVGGAASNNVAYVSKIINSTAVKIDGQPTTASNCGTVVFIGDQFYFGLINATPAFAWGASANCYGYGSAAGTPAANLVGTDELTSSNVGYTVGGFPLVNISPAVSGTVAYWSFAANPSWTGATFSTSGGFIYNNFGRIGGAGGNVTNSGNGRMISIHSFGGVQSRVSGHLYCSIADEWVGYKYFANKLVYRLTRLIRSSEIKFTKYSQDLNFLGVFFMSKYGFVYIWFDCRRRRYYIGSHWGNERDGYVCSSSWMLQAYYRRPRDFKRRILAKVKTSRQDLLKEEQRWLRMISPDEIRRGKIRNTIICLVMLSA